MPSLVVSRRAPQTTVQIINACQGRFGNVDAGNYAEFQQNTGFWVAYGLARPVQGAWVPAQGLRAPGVQPASYVDHGVSGAWEFADGQQRHVACSVRIPPGADLSVGLSILLGWSSPTQDAYCDWNISYLITALDEDTTGAAQQTLQSYEVSSAVANGLRVGQFDIAVAQIGITDVCIHMDIWRDGGDGGDTLGAVAHLHGICLQYVMNQLGASL